MRKTTDPHRASRLAPVLAAAGVTAVVLIFVGTLLWALFAAGGGETFAVGIMVLYALGGIAVIGGVIAAMVQRLREIDGGEADEAKKY